MMVADELYGAAVAAPHAQQLIPDAASCHTWGQGSWRPAGDPAGDCLIAGAPRGLVHEVISTTASSAKRVAVSAHQAQTCRVRRSAVTWVPLSIQFGKRETQHVCQYFIGAMWRVRSPASALVSLLLRLVERSA